MSVPQDIGFALEGIRLITKDGTLKVHNVQFGFEPVPNGVMRVRTVVSVVPTTLPPIGPEPKPQEGAA